MKLSKQERKLLQQSFVVPAPKKKRAFLRTLPKQKVGFGTLLLSQAAYIKKWVWAVSLLLFGGVVLLAQQVEPESLWMLSAIMPVAALLLILELAKSTVYGMAELEMTSRFSLRTILMARMVILGGVQLFGLVLAVPVGGMILLQNGIYLLVPYLLTALLGLMAVRRIHGREGIYVCGSISACVCIFCPLSGRLVPVLYERENVMFWILAAMLLMMGFVKEYKRTMNDLEENIAF